MQVYYSWNIYFSLGLVLSLVYVVLTSTVTNSKIYKKEIINYFDIFTAQMFFFDILWELMEFSEWD